MTKPQPETTGIRRLLFGNYTEYAASLMPIFALCLFLFAFSVGMGYLLGDTIPTTALGEILNSFPDINRMSFLELFGFIAANNAAKSLIFMLAGLVGGIISLFFVIFNGFVIGWIANSLGSVRGLGFVVAGLLPHGIIEIPAILLAMSMGMSLGYTVINSIRGKGGVMKEARTALGLFLTRVVPMLILAAAIEVTITPLVMAILGYV
jgi:stage II sporulation protein M